VSLMLSPTVSFLLGAWSKACSTVLTFPLQTARTMLVAAAASGLVTVEVTGVPASVSLESLATFLCDSLGGCEVRNLRAVPTTTLPPTTTTMATTTATAQGTDVACTGGSDAATTQRVLAECALPVSWHPPRKDGVVLFNACLNTTTGVLSLRGETCADTLRGHGRGDHRGESRTSSSSSSGSSSNINSSPTHPNDAVFFVVKVRSLPPTVAVVLRTVVLEQGVSGLYTGVETKLLQSPLFAAFQLLFRLQIVSRLKRKYPAAA
jgi:hypothetical protein